MWRKITKVIPIDPGTELVTAMQAAAYVLRHNQAVCIFPEGARSVDGTIKEFKKGVGILAAELNVPLVPVYISGAYESLPRSARLPKWHKIMVTFGKAYTADELQTPMGDVTEKDKYATIAQNIRQKVIEIMNYEL
jgi:long-chain acyl-CoA synthetase